MRRSETFALALVCAVLVFDAAPPEAAPEARGASAQRGDDVRSAGPGAASNGPTASSGEAEIVNRVRSLNSTLTERQSRRIAAAVLKYSAKYQLDPKLVTDVMQVESTARPWVRSPAGAVGLMQVMPHMASRLDITGNLTTIESNVEAGCMILADNIRRLGEDDGISAYFWGSEIRGASYLQRVRAARARRAPVEREAES